MDISHIIPHWLIVFFCFLIVSEANFRESRRISMGSTTLSFDAILCNAFNSMGKPWQSHPGLYSTRYLLSIQIHKTYPDNTLCLLIISFSTYTTYITITLYTLFSKCPICKSPLAYGGPSCVIHTLLLWEALALNCHAYRSKSDYYEISIKVYSMYTF